jgi:hypothetical protein
VKRLRQSEQERPADADQAVQYPRYGYRTIRIFLEQPRRRGTV